jgi:hypothetical protein
MTPVHPAQRMRLIVGVLIVSVSAAASLAGFPTWLILIAGALPWSVIWWRRFGAATSIAITVLATATALLFFSSLTALFGLGLHASVVIVWAALGILGVVLAVRTVELPRRVGSLWPWLGSSVGGAVFLAVMAATNVIPGASRFSWVMLGDSANNVIFAREAIYRGGVAIGAGENPVPLPSLLMAIFMGAGRDGVAPQDYLRHDIAAFSQIWMLLVALTCLLSGVVVLSIVRKTTDSSLFRTLAATGGSLLPLSWFFTGYPIEFGFFNTHVALPIVFAAFLVYLAAPRHPALTLSLLAVSGTLLLAVWSPLVLMPLMLGLVVAIRHGKAIVRSRGLTLVILIAGVAQVILYGVLVVLPSLVRNGHFLSAPGGVYGFPKWMIIALAVVVLVLGVLAFAKPLRDPVVVGVVALVAASAVGLLALLFVTRDQENPWSYYPLKFAWLASTILVVLLVGLSAAVVARFIRHRMIRVLALAVVAAMVVCFFNWAPTSAIGYGWKDPIPRILSGSTLGEGDAVAEDIFAIADPGQSHLFWQSDDEFEGVKNFWLLQMWSNSMTENQELRRAAYGLYDDTDINELCRIVGLMGGGTIVHSSDTALEFQLQEACAEQRITVVEYP